MGVFEKRNGDDGDRGEDDDDGGVLWRMCRDLRTENRTLRQTNRELRAERDRAYEIVDELSQLVQNGRGDDTVECVREHVKLLDVDDL